MKEDKELTDIEALKKIFNVKNLRYINIHQEEKLQGIVQTWPLIAELQHLQKTLQKK